MRFWMRIALVTWMLSLMVAPISGQVTFGWNEELSKVELSRDSIVFDFILEVKNELDSSIFVPYILENGTFEKNTKILALPMYSFVIPSKTKMRHSIQMVGIYHTGPRDIELVEVLPGEILQIRITGIQFFGDNRILKKVVYEIKGFYTEKWTQAFIDRFSKGTGDLPLSEGYREFWIKKKVKGRVKD